ncbi:MAG TPA: ABC transporter ATP-binding protein [Acidimicrobiales bacterium]|nr:ABC transporter ATP-binding protein [Acidimicrobiales bacterium]
MADDAAIVVDSVSKRFRLYRERSSSLKEMLTRQRGSRFEEFWALRDVSLSVDRGTTFGLIGHNGSGKSTLLRLMAGIHRATTGSVAIDGRVSALLELGAGFHPELSGRENAYLNGAILGLTRRQIDARIDTIIEFSGLEEFIDSPVKVYSSGMYVRLGFAVAVHVDPDILIIDEVIAVGDEDFQRRCFDHLYKLRRRGVTIVVVSHSLGLMQTLCDQVAWLDHGVLQQAGPAPEVVRAYLEQVNTEEAERIESDDAKRAAASGLVPQLDLEDGQRPISIESVEFVDAGGSHLAVAATGRPLTIRIRYDAHRPVERPYFSFAVEDMAGVHIANPSVRAEDRAPDLVLSGRGYVDYAVPKLSLGAGDYELSIAIHDEHAMVRLDYKARVARLHVQPGDQPIIGKIDLLGTWAHPQPDLATR